MNGKQSVQLMLDSETLRQAEALARDRQISVDAMLADYVEKVVRETVSYEAARESALSFLEEGFHLGGQRPRREDFYER